MNLKIRVFKLVTGIDLICSVIPFDLGQHCIVWGKTPKNKTHGGGISMVMVENPAVIEGDKLWPYMDGLHNNKEKFMIKEEHCMHILEPSEYIYNKYMEWL